MAYDCYCAICGVGFCGMKIETPSPTAPERRKRWIEKRRRALQAGEDFHQLSQVNEDAVHNYDPQIVGGDNIAWLHKAHGLGVHSLPNGTDKAFISGLGYYADEGELIVKSAIGPNQSLNKKVYTCYGRGSEEAPGPVLPIHGPCFDLLTRVLTGSTDDKNVNLNVLYSIMSELGNDNHSALRLSYGDEVHRAQGRYWECIPGTEFCATSPTESLLFNDFIQNELAKDEKFKGPSTKVHLGERHPVNPFGRLPVEIVQQICMLLPGDSLKALSQASLSVRLVTQANSFWKRFAQLDMPWLWELDAARGQKQLPPDINYRKLYLWFDKMTAPRYGMDDLTLIGVANRRRIWGVCEQLATGYAKAMRTLPAGSKWGRDTELAKL